MRNNWLVYSVKDKSLFFKIWRKKIMQQRIIAVQIMFFFISIIASNNIVTAAQIPVPDHIVFVFLENHGYEQLIGNAAAPYFNSLASDSSAALFTQ
jgi:hypothetical protein